VKISVKMIFYDVTMLPSAAFFESKTRGQAMHSLPANLAGRDERVLFRHNNNPVHCPCPHLHLPDIRPAQICFYILL